MSYLCVLSPVVVYVYRKNAKQRLGYVIDVGNATFPMKQYSAEEKKELVNAFVNAGIKL